MKKIFFLLIFVLLIAGGIIVYQTPYSSCNTPIPYRFGSIDPRFNLTQAEVSSDLQKATTLWSSSAGKPLFVNLSSAKLTVNFVYDRRSALNTQINQMKDQLSQKNATLQQQIDDYHAKVKAFEQKLKDYNATVEKYNREGGVTQEIYDNLVSQQNQLRTEGNTLNAKAKELNLSARDYNSQVQNVNQNVNQFNQAISQEPEEGFYNGENRTITIYFANDQNELIHTLAHEFGHALGILHIQNPQGIMYSQTSETTSLTTEDKQQLAEVCQEYPLLFHWREVLHERLIVLRSTLINSK